MAETAPQPLAAERPEPYAGWLRHIDDARSVLDGLLLHWVSPSNTDRAHGCVSFVARTLGAVRVAYGIRHAKDEGVVAYDIPRTHAIGILGVLLLKQDAQGVGGQARPCAKGPGLLQRLCRACSGICTEFLVWLRQAAVDGLSPTRAPASSQASLAPPIVPDGGWRAPEEVTGGAP